jgi:hypothetical protein
MSHDPVARWRRAYLHKKHRYGILTALSVILSEDLYDYRGYLRAPCVIMSDRSISACCFEACYVRNDIKSQNMLTRLASLAFLLRSEKEL